jgi:hypothetical protein
MKLNGYLELTDSGSANAPNNSIFREGSVFYKKLDNTVSKLSSTSEAIVLTNQPINTNVGLGSLAYYDSNVNEWYACDVADTPTGVKTAASDITIFGKANVYTGLNDGELYWQNTSTWDQISLTGNGTKIGQALSSTTLLVDIDTELTGSSMITQFVNETISANYSGSLVAYWESDDSGTFPDATGNGHTGTINGATFTASGFINGAYDYDGVNDEVTVTDSDDFSFVTGGTDTAFSISFWIYHDSTSGADTVIAKQNQGTNEEWFIYLGGTGIIIVRMCSSVGNNTEVFTTGTVSQSAWHHIVITYDGSESISGVTIYLDGASASLDTPSVTGAGFTGFTNTAEDVRIGSRRVGGGANNFFDGKIDEIGVWKGRELNLTEVASIYNDGAGIPYD